MTLGKKSWREVILYKNTKTAYGFRVASLWPLFFPSMQRHSMLFKDIDIKDSEKNLTWMRCRETFRMDVMSLPQSIYRQPLRRRTVEVNNWLLLIEHFRQIYP